MFANSDRMCVQSIMNVLRLSDILYIGVLSDMDIGWMCQWEPQLDTHMYMYVHVQLFNRNHHHTHAHHMTMMSSVISSVLSFSVCFGGNVPGRYRQVGSYCYGRTLVPRHALKFCFLCCVSLCTFEKLGMVLERRLGGRQDRREKESERCKGGGNRQWRFWPSSSVGKSV